MDGSYWLVLQVGGVVVNQQVNKSEDGQAVHQVTLPPGKAGQLTTRTDDNTGVVTLSAGHGLSNGTYDLHWAGGSRSGMSGVVAGNEITLDGGAGSNLPVQGTAVVVGIRVTINTFIDGDNLELFGLHATKQAAADFRDSTPASVKRWHLADNGADSWFNGSVAGNPLTGNPVATIVASNGNASLNSVLTVLALYNSTP